MATVSVTDVDFSKVAEDELRYIYRRGSFPLPEPVPPSAQQTELERTPHDEFETVWGRLSSARGDRKVRLAMSDRRTRVLSGLCFSGGGIRSAAFSLGVIEALAERRLLSQFHYVSSVSG